MKYNNLKPSFIAFLLLLGTSTPPAYAQYITEYEQDYELCQKVGGDVSGPFCYLRGELGYFEMGLRPKGLRTPATVPGGGVHTITIQGSGAGRVVQHNFEFKPEEIERQKFEENIQRRVLEDKARASWHKQAGEAVENALKPYFFKVTRPSPEELAEQKRREELIREEMKRRGYSPARSNTVTGGKPRG